MWLVAIAQDTSSRERYLLTVLIQHWPFCLELRLGAHLSPLLDCSFLEVRCSFTLWLNPVLPSPYTLLCKAGQAVSHAAWNFLPRGNS